MSVFSRRTKSVYKAIKNYIEENGYPPTVREIGKKVGLKSPASVQNHINKLKRKGYIENKNDMPRTLKIKKDLKIKELENDNSQKFYTVNQIAEMLQLDPQTIRTKIKEDKLKSYKIGNNYRISQKQLQDFLQKESN